MKDSTRPIIQPAGIAHHIPDAPIFPDKYQAMGSLEFSKFLLDRARVAVSPGIGFGQYGDEYVRFALVENEHRTRQAIQGIKRIL